MNRDLPAIENASLGKQDGSVANRAEHAILTTQPADVAQQLAVREVFQAQACDNDRQIGLGKGVQIMGGLYLQTVAGTDRAFVRAHHDPSIAILAAQSVHASEGFDQGTQSKH
ncbi:MAG: hypothetical protein JJ992_19225 [Planctomycetes bacterium]|nr:hypothetical protein [Planctomycetota bacterium]